MTVNRARESSIDDDPKGNLPTDEPNLRSEELCRLAQTRDGKMVYNPRDIFIDASIKRNGEFSSSKTELFGQLCGPGDTVIDIGANIGARTVAPYKRVGLGIRPRVQSTAARIPTSLRKHGTRFTSRYSRQGCERYSSSRDAGRTEVTNFKRWEVKVQLAA